MSKIFWSFWLWWPVVAERGACIVIKDADWLNGTVSWECLRPGAEEENFIEVGRSVFECTKKNLYIGLINNADSDCVDIGDGITFSRERTHAPSTREIFTSGKAGTFRGLLDGYANFLSQRSARWDLGFVYPGLVLRVGPTMSGSGFLEFGLEKRLDYNDRANLGPGQMIIRRTILPHLLGFRMSLSSLLPLILGIILVVTKNAFVFAKVTLALSVLLTLKSLFLIQTFRPNEHHHHHPYRPPHPIANDPVDFDDGITVTTVNRPRPQGYSISESLSDAILTQMASKLPAYIGAQDNSLPKRSKSGKRNFSWEKK